jgi:hypothetical protein
MRFPPIMRSVYAVASPSRHKVDHLAHGEAVRPHHRFGAAITAGGKQFEGAAAVGIGTAVVASGRHRCTVTIIAPTGRDLSQHRRRRGHRDQLTNAALAAWFGAPDTQRVKESPVVPGGLSQ